MVTETVDIFLYAKPGERQHEPGAGCWCKPFVSRAATARVVDHGAEARPGVKIGGRVRFHYKGAHARGDGMTRWFCDGCGKELTMPGDMAHDKGLT